MTSMKYLYIPTTTLNFNNIFSTESISPIGFYPKRGFGYSKLESTPPNRLQNFTLLYSKYPVFEIQDDGRDNYPMVIRIEKDLIPEVILKKVCSNNEISTFSVNQTIYFRPEKTTIYFRSDSEQKNALIRSESSITTKNIKLYNSKFQIHNKNNEPEFSWDGALLKDIYDHGEIQPFIDIDRRIDRLKGFLYGYILGADKSVTKEEALMQAELREFQNKFYSLSNNPRYNFSDEYLAKIKKAFYVFETTCRNPSRSLYLKTIQDFPVEITNRSITEFLPKNIGFPISPFVRLINEYCLNSNFKGDLSDTRLDIAKEIGITIKKIVGQKWEGSLYKKYINELLNNIKSAKRFEFESFDHLAIQSVAAFLLKGDDLKTLESFLKTHHRIGDLRFAFAFWGSMYGFSKIPKTEYDNLYEQNGDYPNNLFKFVYDLLENNLYETGSPSTNTVTDLTPAPYRTIDDHVVLGKLKEKFQGIDPWIPAIIKLLDKHGGKISKKFISDLNKKKIPDLGGKLPGIAKKDIINFFNKNQEVNNRNKKQLTQGQLFPQKDQTTNQKENIPVNSDKKLHDGQNSWLDSHEVQQLIECLTPTELKDEIIRNLKWFKKEWRKPDSKYYGKNSKHSCAKITIKDRTDNQAIDAFCKRIKNTIEKKRGGVSYQDFIETLPKRLKQECQKGSSKIQNGKI